MSKKPQFDFDPFDNNEVFKHADDSAAYWWANYQQVSKFLADERARNVKLNDEASMLRVELDRAKAQYHEAQANFLRFRADATEADILRDPYSW